MCLTILSYALHVLRYPFAQGWPLYHAVSLLQHFLSLPACKFRPTCRSCERKSSRIERRASRCCANTAQELKQGVTSAYTTPVRYRTGEALFTNSANATVRRAYHVSPAFSADKFVMSQSYRLWPSSSASSRQLRTHGKGSGVPKRWNYEIHGTRVISVARLS